MGHNLALLQSSPYLNGCFRCNLCREEGCGPVYHCHDCDFDLHTSCAAMGAQQTHFCHPYHLLHLSRVGHIPRRCDCCGIGIRTWSFRCDACDFDIHSTCARAPRFILHPHHPDPLLLSDSGPASGLAMETCDGCKMPVSGFFYRCRSCHYNLDQVCATLPTEIKHARHQAHRLNFVDHSIRQAASQPKCDKCREAVKGWGFHCRTCSFNLHPRCADLVHELPHADAADAGLDRHERSKAQTIVSHCSSASSVSSSDVLHALTPSKSDWEAVERVLRFAQAKAKTEETLPLTQLDEQQDECPTCLEGFSPTNPKTSTSCGHYFHLPCILEWLEQSDNCPICRMNFTLVA